MFGRPDDHHRVPTKLDNVTAIPGHHVDQHGKVLISVRLELLRVQPGAKPREPGNIRKQERRRKPLGQTAPGAAARNVVVRVPRELSYRCGWNRCQHLEEEDQALKRIAGGWSKELVVSLR